MKALVSLELPLKRHGNMTIWQWNHIRTMRLNSVRRTIIYSVCTIIKETVTVGLLFKGNCVWPRIANIYMASKNFGHAWQQWLKMIACTWISTISFGNPDLKRTSIKCCSYSTAFTSYRLLNTHSNQFLAKTKPILTEKALVVIINASSVHLMDHLFPHFTKNTRAHEYLPPSKAIPLIGLQTLK